MRTFFFTVIQSFILCLFTHPIAAQEVLFLDTDEMRGKFETSLAVIREYLEVQDPPKYHLNKAVIEFSVTTGADGSVAGKIPVGIVNVSFEGEYGQVATSREKYEYVPRDSVPVNFDDLGIAEFLSGLQKRVNEDLAKSGFVVTSATHTEEFVAAMNGEGKLEFFGLASVAANAEAKNSHKMTFHFCLLGNDGACIQ